MPTPTTRASWCLDQPCVGWYSNAMTAHRNCHHPKTKAARARCRKGKAEVAEILRQAEVEDKIYHDTHIRPLEEQETARDNWLATCEKFCEAHVSSAEQNADDTASEENFEPYSKRWYDIAVSTLHNARDTADRVFDINDPRLGDYLELNGHTYWVDKVAFPSRGPYIILIDREGTRKKYTLTVLKMALNAADRELIERTPELDKAYTQYISDGIGDTDGYYAPLDFQAWAHTFGKGI